MDSKFLQKKEIVILVESLDSDRPAWWYVKCHNRISAEKLKGVCKNGAMEQIPLEEYGEIIFSGWGEHPPVEIAKQIESKYN